MGFKTRKPSTGLAARVDALVDEACACEDLESAIQFPKKIMSLVKVSEVPSKSDQQKILDSMTRMSACLARIIESTEHFSRNDLERLERLSGLEPPSEDGES